MSQQLHQHPRRILLDGASRKRKEKEASYPHYPPLPKANPAQHQLTAEPEPIPSNRLLAGYMAYEFLTRGTLLGQRFETARAEPRRGKQLVEGGGSTGNYAEVAGLLRGEGAHIPGVINPSQLARWIQM